jgi:imidazolonepropionase-like amidohydrolase
MDLRRISFGLAWILVSGAALSAQRTPLVVEHGVYNVHLLMHSIGTEEYSVVEPDRTHWTMTTQSHTADRGMQRISAMTLTLDRAFSPVALEQHRVPASDAEGASTLISSKNVVVREADVQRTMVRPAIAFVGSASMPASLQMMMMRYWKRHGSPSRLTILRASSQALPLEIKLVGHDVFQSRHRIVRLSRYTIANLVFGREVLWMNDSGRLAAVMTFAGGLPQELVLDEYEPAMGELVHSGVRQEMLDLADLGHQIKPEAEGSYAIVGARLIDGTGATAVENATVVVRDGRIVSAGHGDVPAGLRVIHAEGQSLLPGLWEMHTHYSGVEFGPALLAAGVTTARDCGGELEFLTQVRKKIDEEYALGPRLLLAGLIDSGGPLAFGNVDVHTPAEGVAAVDVYADEKFDQIKVYTQIQPDVLKAIGAEAHRRGMTVTGHVPAAIDAFAGVADGMDQINHMQFVIRAMMPPGVTGPVDVHSKRAVELIALLKEKQIVVDPTNGWGEMAGHPKSVDVASFEPGIKAAPYTLAAKYRGLGVAAVDEAKFHERMANNAAVLRALYEAGVPIVAGSDTGLIGYGLDRELELYVQAGMTPMAAIQTATLAAARAMKMEKDSGTIEVGKRADLVLVEGNPLQNISDIRRVVSVVKDGRMYDSKRMGRLVGFNR